MTSPEHDDQDARKLKVLIADDAQTTRRGTRLMLALHPRVEVVAIAHNGRQAVEALKRTRDIDLALVDVNMPELDGISAIAQMIAIKPELVCVIISAERGNSFLRRAMAAGARDYLIKPYTVDELEAMIDQVYRLIEERWQKTEEDTEVRQQRDAYARKLAAEYARTRRTDDQAIQVFEYLAGRPNCDIKWVKHLAMLYTLRGDWDRLEALAARMKS